MPTTQIDWDRADIVFGRLLDALKEERYPYDVAKPPERKENLPEQLVWGSVEHARFLFCVCYYMRGGIESDTAILALTRVFNRRPELFDPSYFANPFSDQNDKEGEMRDILTAESLNYNAKETSRHWVANFQKLHRFWGSDPAELFRKATSFEDACTVIMHKSKKSPEDPHGFYGFKHKMVSMLIHFLMGAGIIEPFLFPVPVDFHVLRIMVSHELLTTTDVPQGENLYSTELLAAARELSQKYCVHNGVDPLRLGEALWLLSRTLCHRHPGNRTKAGKRDGRKTELTPEPVVWGDIQEDNYHAACGQCPVRSTCLHNVPSAEYYVRGRLVARGWRKRPPQFHLFNKEPDTAEP